MRGGELTSRDGRRERSYATRAPRPMAATPSTVLGSGAGGYGTVNDWVAATLVPQAPTACTAMV